MKQFFLVFSFVLSALFIPIAAFAQSETGAESSSESEAQLEAARSRVAERATAYINLRQQTPNLNNASQEQRNEVQAAQEQFMASQYTVARLSNAQTTHTVEIGDSLSQLAVEFYQDGECWPFIVDANSYLEDPDMIIPGLVLVIPTL